MKNSFRLVFAGKTKPGRGRGRGLEGMRESLFSTFVEEPQNVRLVTKWCRSGSSSSSRWRTAPRKSDVSTSLSSEFRNLEKQKTAAEVARNPPERFRTTRRRSSVSGEKSGELEEVMLQGAVEEVRGGGGNRLVELAAAGETGQNPASLCRRVSLDEPGLVLPRCSGWTGWTARWPTSTCSCGRPPCCAWSVCGFGFPKPFGSGSSSAGLKPPPLPRGR